MFVLPFNPLGEFSHYDQNGRNKWTSRLVLWLWMIIYSFTFVLLQDELNTGSFEFWALMAITGFVKYVAIGFFFLSTAVAWAICAVEKLSGRGMLVLVSFTFLPNYLELFAHFYLPEYGFYSMAVLAIWRIIIMVLGMYIIADITMKQAIITTVISFWFLYPWDFILFLM